MNGRRQLMRSLGERVAVDCGRRRWENKIAVVSGRMAAVNGTIATIVRRMTAIDGTIATVYARIATVNTRIAPSMQEWLP